MTTNEDLKKKFFDECTKWTKSDGGPCGYLYVSMLPNDLFEWIEQNILQAKQQEEKSDISCPFCEDEDDFDLPGLKRHIKHYCEGYSKTENV